MDRPLSIIVADSISSLYAFEASTLRADVVLVANKVPEHRRRAMWGHARFECGESGSISLGGVGLAWGPGPELNARVEESDRRQVLAVASSAVPPEHRAAIESRAYLLQIGQGVYSVTIGRFGTAEDIERLEWAQETRKPAPWKKPRKPKRKPEPEPEPAPAAPDEEEPEA